MLQIINLTELLAPRVRLSVFFLTAFIASVSLIANNCFICPHYVTLDYYFKQTINRVWS